MYAIKEGVHLWMTPQIVKMLDAIYPLYSSVGIPMVITSAMDGQHGANSLHYCGRAIDIRTMFPDKIHQMTWQNIAGTLVGHIKEVYKIRGYPVDVVLETDHLHLEWDEHGRKI